jgi:hypothetical protein
MLSAFKMKGKVMNRYFPITIAAMLFAFFLSMEAIAADPFEGTWKLNPALSKFQTSPAPKSQTVKIESLKNAQNMVADEVDAAGNVLHGGFFAKFNEMDYPYTLHPTVNTIALKRTNKNTIITTTKKNGEEVARIRWVVSKDGNTMSGTEITKGRKAEKVISTYVFERQNSYELSQSSEQREPMK